MATKGFDKVIKRAQALQKSLAKRVPVLIQAEAVRHYRANFKAQGWVNNGTHPWKKRDDGALPKGKGKKPRRILVDRALLLNSIRPDGQATWQRIGVHAGGPHVPYAKTHNEGGTIRGTFAVRQHERRARGGKVAKVHPHTRTVNTTIPNRQFICDSAELRVKAKAIILREATKILTQ